MSFISSNWKSLTQKTAKPAKSTVTKSGKSKSSVQAPKASRPPSRAPPQQPKEQKSVKSNSNDTDVASTSVQLFDRSVSWPASRPPSLRSSPSASDLWSEVCRHRTIQALHARFDQLTSKKWKLGNNKFNHFEKWLLELRLKRELSSSPSDHQGDEPLIPSAPLSNHQYWTDVDIFSRMKEGGASEREAKEVCLALAKEAHEALNSMRHQIGRPQPVKVTAEAFISKGGVERMKLSGSGLNFDINTIHYDKLCALHRHLMQLNLPSSSSASAQPCDEHIFRLLVRYSSLQGASTRGGGYQSAIPEQCFDVLRDEFGVCMELFASPLNCRFPRFCSAFADTDEAFGSMGSFCDFTPVKEAAKNKSKGAVPCGSFEANPPFEPALIEQMAERMDELIGLADQVDSSEQETKQKAGEFPAGALSFIVIIPSWPDKSCWQRLNSSRYLTRHLCLPRFAHAFVEGDQHTQKNRYRVSVYDTSIFFLQSRRGQRAWPVTEDKLKKMVEAFQPIARAKKEVDLQSATSARSATESKSGREDLERPRKKPELKSRSLPSGKGNEPQPAPAATEDDQDTTQRKAKRKAVSRKGAAPAKDGRVVKQKTERKSGAKKTISKKMKSPQSKS